MRSGGEGLCGVGVGPTAAARGQLRGRGVGPPVTVTAAPPPAQRADSDAARVFDSLSRITVADSDAAGCCAAGTAW